MFKVYQRPADDGWFSYAGVPLPDLAPALQCFDFQLETLNFVPIAQRCPYSILMLSFFR